METGIDWALTRDEKFRYQLLDRMRCDCDYFLGNGQIYGNHLWAGSVDKQIAAMKALWKSFPADRKTEWLTWEQIEEYEVEMTTLGLEWALAQDESFRRSLLQSMFSDCLYFLRNGKNTKDLWAGSEAEQITAMKELWNSLPENGKPEILTWKQIEEFETAMVPHNCNVEQNVGQRRESEVQI